jgi:preprotein translocase subunit SecG
LRRANGARAAEAARRRATVLNILFVVQTILAVTLIVALLLQLRGQGFTGSFGGGSDSIYRTRRGVEKTLFQFTIGLAVAFMLIAVVTSIYKG